MYIMFIVSNVFLKKKKKFKLYENILSINKNLSVAPVFPVY